MKCIKEVIEKKEKTQSKIEKDENVDEKNVVCEKRNEFEVIFELIDKRILNKIVSI